MLLVKQKHQAMEIKHVQEESKGYFQAIAGDVEAGRMTYSRAGTDKIIIDHTEVSPDFGGQGVGKKLLMAAVNYLRENQVKAIPLCPFAKSIFDKMPEIRDVLS